MATIENLKPIQKGQLSKEELKQRGSNGGKKSGEVRREMKLFKQGIAEKLGYEDFDAIINTLIKNAKENGGKDFEILRDTLGQKPVEIQQITTVPIIEDDIK